MQHDDSTDTSRNPGWTREEKGLGATKKPAPDPAGEASPKGSPSDDRQATETAVQPASPGSGADGAD